MALGFNSKGYLVPGMHCCCINEFKHFFVDKFPESLTREKILNNFVSIVNLLAGLGLENIKLWIDGSYTTCKINPGDIDFCILIDSIEIENLDFNKKQAIRDMGTNGFHDLLRKYDCDFYLVIDVDNNPGYPEYNEWKANKQYWNDWWSHDRNGIEKGYVQIEVKGGIIQ